MIEVPVLKFNVEDYKLPDMHLLKNNVSDFDCSVFIPENLSIVLGKGSDPEKSIEWNMVKQDLIDVYKRPSGGESVIISENTIIIAIVKRGEKFKNPSVYFEKYNDAIIKSLTGIGVRDLKKRGFSDICIGEKKILGSSIYRTGDRVFYHAVLNVSESVETIERYLKHPVREPEYRKKRSHSEFVTSLSGEGYNIDKKFIIEILISEINKLKG